MIFAGSKNFSGHIREFWCSNGVNMFKKKNSIDAKKKPAPSPKKKTGALAWFAKAAGDVSPLNIASKCRGVIIQIIFFLSTGK